MRELTTRYQLEKEGQSDTTQREILNRIAKIENRLSVEFKTEEFENGEFFVFGEQYFRVDCIEEYNAVVVEYGKKCGSIIGRLEDGDLFYMDEMSEDEMIEAIIREVEG